MRDLSMPFGRIASTLLVAAALASPLTARAQSLFASRGLGLPAQPADSRVRGMGGVALGLEGADLAWANPADVLGVLAPGFRVAYQYDDFTATHDGRDQEGGTARFPLVLGAFPVGSRTVLMLGAASFLDQNWAIERQDTLIIGGDSVGVLDRFTSEGGVTQLRVGAAYRVLSRLAVGAGFDYYVGSVKRTGGRLFPGEANPGCCLAEWTYGGAGGSVGAEWRAGAVTVAGAASFGGTLEAETQDSAATSARYDIPLRFSAGASGRVANDLLLALSGEWSGWSSLNEALAEEGGARDVVSLHGGAEWDGARLFNRPLPVRIGARRTGLPFAWGTPDEPTGWADETALTSGLGLVLAGGAVRADLSAERGRRGGSEAGLEESFWRTTFSVTILGR
jgi:hypothetical protein